MGSVTWMGWRIVLPSEQLSWGEITDGAMNIFLLFLGGAANLVGLGWMVHVRRLRKHDFALQHLVFHRAASLQEKITDVADENVHLIPSGLPFRDTERLQFAGGV